jgi:cell division FtsZ-interacting protein ZapD
MRRRKRIARALDWLIAGWIESPVIDQEMLDALISAVAAREAEGNTWDRATNSRAECPPPTK